MNESTTGTTIIQVYKKRWLVLALAGVLACFCKYFVMSYGPIDNVISAYFHVDQSKVDWVTLSTYVASLVVLSVLAYCSFNEIIDLKLLLLMSGASFLLNSVAIAISYINSSLFPFMIGGQLLGGFFNSTLFIIMAEIAAIWFPESHNGMVMGIGTMTWNVGVLLAEVVPENVFQNPPDPKEKNMHNKVNNFNKTSQVDSFNLTHSHWYARDKLTAQIIAITMSCVAFLVILFVITFVPSYPTYPPSKSQAVRLANRANKQKSSWKDFLLETKSLFGDVTFVLIQVVLGLTVQTFVLETVLIVQIINPIHSALKTKLTSNEIGGYVIACRSFGDMIGSFVGGKVLDKYRNYRLQNSLSLFATAISMVFFTMSWHFASLAGLFLSIFIMGFISYFSVVALFDAIVQHTYPKNIAFVSSWACFLRFIITVIMTSLARLVYEKTDTFGLLVFHVCLQIVGFVLSLFINPTLKRQIQEKSYDSEEERPNDSTPLISQRN